MRNYHRWTEADDAILRARFAELIAAELAALIGVGINDPRVDLTMTMSEVITETRQKPVAVGLAYLYRVYMLIDAFPH